MLQLHIIAETRAEGIRRLLPAAREQFSARYPLARGDVLDRGARYLAELNLDEERSRDAKLAREMGRGL